jgi:hypothetical protein
MFSNLLGCTSGGSGNGNENKVQLNASKSMDMLVDPDEEGDKYVQITQPEAEMAAAAPSQATNAVQLPPAVGGNAGNQGQSEYLGFDTALKSWGTECMTLTPSRGNSKSRGPWTQRTTPLETISRNLWSTCKKSRYTLPSLRLSQQ